METFADYILAEKDYGRKIEIMHYLKKKTNIFFDFGVLIGNYSFGIYLTHILLMRILEKTIYLIIPSRFPISIIIIFTFELIFISLFKKFFGKKISGWIGLI